MFCPKCGKEIAAIGNPRFCSNCGIDIQRFLAHPMPPAMTVQQNGNDDTQAVMKKIGEQIDTRQRTGRKVTFIFLMILLAPVAIVAFLGLLFLIVIII